MPVHAHMYMHMYMFVHVHVHVPSDDRARVPYLLLLLHLPLASCLLLLATPPPAPSCTHSCECLCRLAVLKALPTDAEIEEARAANPSVTDAASYMEYLQVEDADHHAAILAERATPWGAEPAQPLERCLAHTFSLTFRYIQRTKRGRQAPKTSSRERGGERGRAAPSAAPSAASENLTAAALTEADIKMWFSSHKQELSKLGV